MKLYPRKRTTTAVVKTIGALAAAAMMIGLAACSDDEAGPDVSGPVEGEIQLGYWGSSTRVEKTNEMLKVFSGERPEVTVRPQVTDFENYFRKLNVQAASQDMPCVAGMQTRQLGDYTSNETLEPLDSLIDSGAIDVSDIPDSILDSGRGPDGKLYMIPYGVAWNAFFINKTVAEKHGVEPLPMSYTWDELKEWLTDAKSKLPADVAPMDETGGEEALFSAYILGNDMQMFNDEGKIGFDKQAVTDYWTMWDEWREAGLTNSMQNSVSEAAQVEQHSVVRGRVLMQAEAGNAFVAASQAAPDTEFVEVPFPEGSSGNGNMFFTSGWSIPKNCDNPAAAAAFIDFWTNNDEAAGIYLSDNGAVANERQLEQQIENPEPKQLKVVLETYQYILDQDVPNPTIPPGYNATFQQSYEREYEKLAFDKKPINEAVDTFFSEANGSLGDD